MYATEVLVPKEKELFIFPCADSSENWQEKVLKSNQDTEKGEEHRIDLHGETDDLDSAEQRREQDDLEAQRDFWSLWKLHLPSSRSGKTKTKCASGKLVSIAIEEC